MTKSGSFDTDEFGRHIDRNNQSIFHDPDIVAPQIITLCLIFVCSLFGNGLICMVFYKKPHLLTVSHAFVLNLAICDIALTLLVLPFMFITAIHQDWIFAQFWCQAQGFIATMLFVTSTFTLLVVSADRYYAIVSPLRYPRLFTSTRGYVIVALTWIVGIAVALPPVFRWGEYKYQRGKVSCAIVWSSKSELQGYGLFFSIAGFGVPTLVMTWCYCGIFRAAVSHYNRSNRVLPVSNSDPDLNTEVETSTIAGIITRRQSIRNGGSRRQDCKAARTLLLIAMSFLSCWVPYFIMSGIEANDTIIDDRFETAAIWMAYCTCVLNPCIYGYLNRIMRTEMGRLLKFNRNEISSSTGPDSEDAISTTYTHLSALRNTRSNSIVSRLSARSSRYPSISVIEMDTIAERSEEALLQNYETINDIRPSQALTEQCSNSDGTDNLHAETKPRSSRLLSSTSVLSSGRILPYFPSHCVNNEKKSVDFNLGDDDVLPKTCATSSEREVIMSPIALMKDSQPDMSAETDNSVGRAS